MTEIELSAMSRDLPERVGDRTAMVKHVGAWEGRRNGAGVKAEWQFTAADARTKLLKLYPTIEMRQSPSPAYSVTVSLFGGCTSPGPRQMVIGSNEVGLERAYFKDECPNCLLVDWREVADIVTYCARASNLETLTAN